MSENKLKNFFVNNKKILIKIGLIALISIFLGLLNSCFLTGNIIDFSNESVYWISSTIIQALAALLALSVPFAIYLVNKINESFIKAWKRKEEFELVKGGKGQPNEAKRLDKFLKETKEIKKAFYLKRQAFRESLGTPVILICITIIIALGFLPFGKSTLLNTSTLKIINFIVSSIGVFLILMSIYIIYLMAVAVLKYLIPTPDIEITKKN